MDLLMIFIMTFVYGLVLLLDFIPILRGKNRKLIWLYLCSFTLSYSLALLIGLGVKIPSPAPLIKNVVTSLIGSSIK